MRTGSGAKEDIRLSDRERAEGFPRLLSSAVDLTASERADDESLVGRDETEVDRDASAAGRAHSTAGFAPLSTVSRPRSTSVSATS
jgi:hypothetical protein